MTLKLGIIGTNWITKMLVEAAHESQAYQLTAVYSRRAETGEAFAKDFGEVTVYTDLAAFYESGIEVVYIASPNSLHYEQTLQAIAHDLHVIVKSQPFQIRRNMKLFTLPCVSTPMSAYLKQLVTCIKLILKRLKRKWRRWRIFPGQR